jgi:hypothetical protein
MSSNDTSMISNDTAVLHPSDSPSQDVDIDHDEDVDHEEDHEDVDDEDEDVDVDDEDVEEDVDHFFKRLSNLEISVKSFSSTLMVGLTVCILFTGIMNMGILVAAGKVLQTCQG